MKLTIKEMREIINEVARERAVINESKRKLTVLEGRKLRINELLAEKSGVFDRIKSAVGISNPSLDVDDPKRVTKTLDKSLNTSQKVASEFQASSLNTTKAINGFHDAVKDSLDKVTSLADTLGAEKATEYKMKMIDLVKSFYSLLKNEVERIQAYQSQIAGDLEDKGLDKRYLTSPDAPEAEEEMPVKKPHKRATSTFSTSAPEPTGKSNQSFKTTPPEPKAPANKSFKTSVPEPKKPANKSFKTDVEEKK